MSEAMTDEQWKRILRYAEGTREMTDREERLDILITEVKRSREIEVELRATIAEYVSRADDEVVNG